MANIQRNGNIAIFNPRSRPKYLSSIKPIEFRERSANIAKVHNPHWVRKAVAYLS
jgi:catalase